MSRGKKRQGLSQTGISGKDRLTDGQRRAGQRKAATKGGQTPLAHTPPPRPRRKAQASTDRLTDAGSLAGTRPCHRQASTYELTDRLTHAALPVLGYFTDMRRRAVRVDVAD
jgi:hypothetical protein